MPTHDGARAVDEGKVRGQIAAECFPQQHPDDPGLRVGLELESFPIRVGPDGGPAGRVPLEGPGGVYELVRGMGEPLGWGWSESEGAAPKVKLPSGGTITFEPGGQIEHSSAVHPTAAAALEELECVQLVLRSGLAPHGVVLANLGFDPWHGLEQVPQMLDAERYRAMAAYFDRRGPEGALMMRRTAAQHVNLDLGPPGVREERWLLAMLLGPLLTAGCAASPFDGAVSRRARCWQGLDPTRTGYPEVLKTSDVLCEMACVQAALDADVMMFWTGPDRAVPAEPGFSFRRWVRDGHPEVGFPTPEDLHEHLTTLFYEVRVRTFLELRSADALPWPWWGVALVLTAGALYDERARERALDLLEPLRTELDETWRRAAVHGLGDDRLAALSAEVWPLALEGARRLPAGFFRPGDVARADAFVDTYTLRRRMPADDLKRRLAAGPPAVLEWAAPAEAIETGSERCLT